MTALLFVHLMTLALFMGLLLSAALGDVKSYRIPNLYSIALVALYPLFAASAPHPVSPLASLGVMAAVLAVTFLAYTRGWLGGGDAKLMSAATLYAGPSLIAEFIVVTTVFGAMLGMMMLNRFLRVNLAAALDYMGNRTLRDALLTDVLPYGVAIAAGGVYLTLRLIGAAAGAA